MTPEAAPRIQKVLVVDDNAMNRQVAEGHLVAAGYAVILAESGEEGLAALEARAPDLVLLDVLMPGLDGFETCKRMKQLPKGKDAPVVFLTALGDLGSHQKAIESGADDFLTKPINRTELLIRVRSLMWVKHLRDELTQGYDLIRSQRDALLQAQRQKAELSALVVHDLKNPLTAILVNVEFLVQQASLAADDRAALSDVFSAAQAMHRMVINLLDISRSEDGMLIPKLGEVALAHMVEEVCGAVGRRSAEQGIKLAHEVGVDTVTADRDLLRRLIENLLDNAIKYAPGGGTIEVRVSPSTDGTCEIHVNDQGPGVPLESREKIFEKYAQLDRHGGAHASHSRGLGLAFCRLAAEAHGGRIWVEENRPRGSSFRVRLPRGRQERD